MFSIALALAVALPCHPARRTQQISQMEDMVRRHPTAAGVRSLADAYVDAHRFGDAAIAYDRASTMYAKLGDPNAAKIFTDLANRYRTSISFYEDLSPEARTDLAKFEPSAGCYIGVNIEREDATRYPQAFNNLIGKHHALFFMYRKYGVAFPRQYAFELRKARCGLQLAFEPTNLYEVRNDEYLQRFAQDAAASGIPIFLRYASEMNGDWTPYHGDPALYVQKFRLVASVMHDLAPNVAMVWCPNEIPERPIPDYWPGDDAVDWVGVNFYSEIYNDADRARGAEWRHPEDALDYVYSHYATHHPMMVGEWAATHRSTVDNRERPDFAAAKIRQFYSSIPRKYPRVKAVSWLSFNALKYANPGRQLNDYSLYDNEAVAAAYTQAILPPYYLEAIDGRAAPRAPRPLVPNGTVAGGETLSAYVRSYDDGGSVTVSLGGQSLGRFSAIGAFEFQIPAGAPAGRQTLNAEVRDSAGRLAGRFSLPITVAAGSA